MPKLEDLKKTEIQQLIRNYNHKFQIKGWSKLSKSDLISKLRNHPRLKITENSMGVKIHIKKEDTGRRLVRVGNRFVSQKKADKEKKEKKEDKKPNIPKITITEADEPTGGAPAEPKSRLGPIPKSNVKIRVGPKKKESVEEQVRRALAESDKKIEKEKKKPKPPADEVERIPEMKRRIKEGRKKGKPVKGLEIQLKELEEKYDLSGIKETKPEKKVVKKKKNNNDEAGPAEPAPRPAPKKKEEKKTAFELKPPKNPNSKYDFNFLRNLPRTRGLSREEIVYKELKTRFTEGQILDMNYLISKGGKSFKDISGRMAGSLPFGVEKDVEGALKRVLTDIKKKAEKAPAKSESLKEIHKKGKQRAEKQYDTDTDEDEEPAPRMTAKERKIQNLKREIGGLKRQIKNLKEEGKSTKFSESQLKKKEKMLKSLQ